VSSYELLILLTSLLAVVVSFVSLVRTRKVALEQLALERVTAELSKMQMKNIKEENDAKNQPKFNVTIQRIGKSSHFYVSNTGQGTAYNVNFELVDCSDSPLTSDIKEKLPYSEMKHNSRFKLMAAIHLNSPYKYDVKLTWLDCDSNPQYENFCVTR
jgi:hypothetical protein